MWSLYAGLYIQVVFTAGLTIWCSRCPILMAIYGNDIEPKSMFDCFPQNRVPIKLHLAVNIWGHTKWSSIRVTKNY